MLKNKLSALFIVCITMLSFSCSKADDSSGSHHLDSKIKGVYFIQHYGSASSYFSAYLLLKDGSIKKHLKHPPKSIDVIQSKKDHPENWGKWHQSNGAIIAEWSDGSSETWDTWYKGMPAEKGEKLKGIYKSQFAIENQNYYAIQFTEDGKFSLMIRKNNTNTFLPGTYLLENYGITLKYDDGHTEHWAFNFYCIGHNSENPKKNTEAFIMAEDNYTLH